MEIRHTGCCGMVELVDISTMRGPKEVIEYVQQHLPRMTDWGASRPAYFIFTGVVDRVTGDHASHRTDNYGEALANYITKHQLGEVVMNIPQSRNWTGNMLQIWVWIPSYRELEDHAALSE